MASNISFITLMAKSQGDSNNFLGIIMDKIMIILYTVTIVFGTTGNGLVIWAAGFRMSPTVTNVWLVNLAVADFIFCWTRVFSLVKKLFFQYWPFGTFLCKFNGLFKYANMFCSVFLLSIISLDRALCVWRPVWTKQRRTVSAARLVSVVVWVLAVALSSPYFIFRQTVLGKNNLTTCSVDPDKKGEDPVRKVIYILRFLCGFLLPFLIIFCCYVLAAVGIRRTRLTRTNKPLKILAGLVLAFFLCWAPYHFLLLAKMINSKSQVVKLGLTVAKGLAYFNSCVNPLLYFCMGMDHRKHFKQSLSVVCKRAMAEDGEGPTATSADGEHQSSAQQHSGAFQEKTKAEITVI